MKLTEAIKQVYESDASFNKDAMWKEFLLALKKQKALFVTAKTQFELMDDGIMTDNIKLKNALKNEVDSKGFNTNTEKVIDDIYKPFDKIKNEYEAKFNKVGAKRDFEKLCAVQTDPQEQYVFTLAQSCDAFFKYVKDNWEKIKSTKGKGFKFSGPRSFYLNVMTKKLPFVSTPKVSGNKLNIRTPMFDIDFDLSSDTPKILKIEYSRTL